MLSFSLYGVLMMHTILWQDVLSAAAVIITSQQRGAGASASRTLEALCMFANGISGRISKQVYQQLCEAVALLSNGAV